MAVVADIVDGNRVLLDGPSTGVAREVYSIKRISVTDLKIDVLKGARTGTIRYFLVYFIEMLGRKTILPINSTKHHGERSSPINDEEPLSMTSSDSKL